MKVTQREVITSSQLVSQWRFHMGKLRAPGRYTRSQRGVHHYTNWYSSWAEGATQKNEKKKLDSSRKQCSRWKSRNIKKLQIAVDKLNDILVAMSVAASTAYASARKQQLKVIDDWLKKTVPMSLHSQGDYKTASICYAVGSGGAVNGNSAK